jgi:predicted dehydrogenase
MSPTSVALPVRIGLIGLGRAAVYHLERIGLRDDIRIIGACDPDPRRANHGAPFCGDVMLRIDEFLRRDDFDWVLLADPSPAPMQTIFDALAAGKNVAIPAPMRGDSIMAQQLITAAEACGKKLCVLATHREGLDFRAAVEVTRDGQLGTIRSARLLSWGTAIPDDDASEDSERSFVTFAGHYLDELLQLVHEIPESMFARIQPGGSTRCDVAFTLSILFQGGSEAVIDVNLQSSVAMHTGWILSGTKGGYQNQRIYIPDPSGEVCDAPVCLLPGSAPDTYTPLLQGRGGEDAFRSAREAARVMQLIDVARESSRSGQPVRLIDV